VESLSLRHAELGSFAMPREWTDWGAPDAQALASAEPLYFDAFALLALAELIASLARRHCEVDQ
jgi:mannose/cellobiose epimerase-like protein (N-acyl-D-glucosamine 2-epimerase family)